MEHFLVPIDFSEYAARALDYAITLAHSLSARLTLLHVIQPLTTGAVDIGVVLPYAYVQQLETDITTTMQSYLDRVLQAGVKGDSRVVHGVPWHEIVELATARKFDMIIMGTHGRTGLTHALLGSVAEKVLRLAPCPVLVVRMPAVSAT